MENDNKLLPAVFDETSGAIKCAELLFEFLIDLHFNYQSRV